MPSLDEATPSAVHSGMMCQTPRCQPFSPGLKTTTAVKARGSAFSRTTRPSSSTSFTEGNTMPLSETCSFVVSKTPEDQTVQSDLVDFLNLALPSKGLLFEIYAATLQPFLDGIVGAYQRGCDVMGAFDHSQYVGQM